MKIEKILQRLLILTTIIVAALKGSSQTDTLFAPNNKQAPVIKWKHPYHQTLTLKLFLSQAEFDGKYKRKDNGESKVYVTIPEALTIIKKIDRITLGIPKIIYLVGWQYNGHDSKYPAWFEGNERLKRPGDKNALESLRWLMAEAKKYHTTVSLHINMFDAYEDSPLWNDYVANNIIAKNEDGSLRAGEWGYPISYAQEWKTGFAQKRIDSLCKLLPIQAAGTIHIDAFHTWPPIPAVDAAGKTVLSFDPGPTSPFLNFTTKDETEAQRNIFQYWAKKGIDVTSEGVDFLRETDFAGLQPMAWWFERSAQDYLRYPAAYYSGGVDRGEWGKLFGTSMHGEQEIKDDPVLLRGFTESFCLNTVIWYYLNRLQRKSVITGDGVKKVMFSENVVSGISNGTYYLLRGKDTLVTGNDIFVPALWSKAPMVIAYSRDGYTGKKWKLPVSFKNVTSVAVHELTIDGDRFSHTIEVKSNEIELSVAAGKAFVLKPMGNSSR